MRAKHRKQNAFPFGSKFQGAYQVWQTPEEWPKYCEYNNQNEHTCPNRIQAKTYIWWYFHLIEDLRDFQTLQWVGEKKKKTQC